MVQGLQKRCRRRVLRLPPASKDILGLLSEAVKAKSCTVGCIIVVSSRLDPLVMPLLLA